MWEQQEKKENGKSIHSIILVSGSQWLKGVEMINGQKLTCSAMTAGAEVIHTLMTWKVLSNCNGGKQKNENHC